MFSGIGSGAVATVLGATIVNRWFKTNRGLVMGLMSASSATGLLVFLPLLAALAQSGGWKPVAIAIAVATACLVPLVWLLVPERPASIGMVRYGAEADDVPPVSPASQGNFLAHTLNTLRRAAGTRVFWYLFATFFVCGFTTNGLVGTHLIAFCGDMGIGEVQAAGLLSMMGIFDLIGTTLSGWLTDRFDPRKLLGVYYAIRGLSLIYLPYSGFSATSLIIFAVLYGLDWIATVPPTLRLANEAFGDRSGPIVFGWIVAGHQVGAATAACLRRHHARTAGQLRTGLPHRRHDGDCRRLHFAADQHQPAGVRAGAAGGLRRVRSPPSRGRWPRSGQRGRFDGLGLRRR